MPSSHSRHVDSKLCHVTCDMTHVSCDMSRHVTWHMPCQSCDMTCRVVVTLRTYKKRSYHWNVVQTVAVLAKTLWGAGPLSAEWGAIISNRWKNWGPGQKVSGARPPGLKLPLRANPPPLNIATEIIAHGRRMSDRRNWLGTVVQSIGCSVYLI